jgi:hypothetical protein
VSATKRKPIRLTAAEIDAILDAAGNADVGAMAETDFESEEEAKRFLAAYESGMDKLREMRARRIADAR